MNDLPHAPLIQTQTGLAALCEGWRSRPALALDTEFVRERTFFAQLALVQVQDGNQCVLLDPLALDLAPFLALLADPGVVKVLHGCSEDLDIFYRLAGVPLQNLFDTQIAWALVDPEGPVSYRRLVAEHFNAEIGTGETRSNWLRRPLSAKQLHYAAQDVRYLLPLYECLSQRLSDLDRSTWAAEECQRLTEPERYEQRPEEAWLRFGGRWKLKPRPLEALRRLAQWRDEQARRRDLPRTFVMRDPQLMQIVEAMPTSSSELAAAADLHPRLLQRHGETILALVDAALKAPEAELPEPPPQPDTSREARTIIKRMHERTHARARELNIAPDVLAPKRLLKALLHRHHGDGPLPAELAGWRKTVITDELIPLLDDWRGRTEGEST